MEKEGEEEKRGKGIIYTVKEREINKSELREKLERKRENEQYKGYVTTRVNQKEGKERTRQKEREKGKEHKMQENRKDSEREIEKEGQS